MTLTKRLVPWCGTVRQPPRPRAIAEYVDESGAVVTWAWTFDDKDNLIIKDENRVEHGLAALGYTIVTHDTGRVVRNPGMTMRPTNDSEDEPG
jgi:hypothetical protein